MVRLNMPYGEGYLSVEVDARDLILVAEPPEPLAAAADQEGEIRRALAAPVGCTRLRDLAGRGKRVAIAISDYTRHTPTGLILPLVLEELNAAGVREEDVTLIVATGLHRPTRLDELESILGRSLLARLRVVNHDPDSVEGLVRLGVTTRGTPVEVNRLFAEAELRVSIGTIEPHHLAGWSGGAKNIIPGLASRAAVLANHALAYEPGCSIGRTAGNPVYEDIQEVARYVAPVFIVNVLLNEQKRVVRAFAGDVAAAHEAAVQECARLVRVPVPELADILLTSVGGAPRDRDFWQAEGKALTRARAVVRRGGVVVLLAECPGGVGHPQFAEVLRTRTAADIREHFRHEEFTTIKNKAYRLAMLLEHASLIMVTRGLSRDDFPGFPITFCRSAEEALDAARGIVGRRAGILAVPRPASVLLEPVVPHDATGGGQDA